MRRLKKELFWCLWITLLSVVLLSTGTYAWMSIANSIRVSDLELNVVTENAMEIALDVNGEPGDWTTILSFEDLLDPETAISPATWSAEQQGFMTVSYGLDGRAAGLLPITTENINDSIQAPSAAQAEADGGAGYLIALDLWVRTGSSQASVYLSEPAQRTADELGAGTWVIGEPVWNAGSVRHDDGGNGAEKCIRMGFLSYDEDYDKGSFVIYEPNTTIEETTSSVDGGNLEGDGKLIKQATTTFTEQEPVLRDSVNYQMGEFLSESRTLFTLKSGTPRKFTLYIWLEGQDPQCVNSISGGKLLANVQFGANTGDDRENIYRPTEARP